MDHPSSVAQNYVQSQTENWNSTPSSCIIQNIVHRTRNITDSIVRAIVIHRNRRRIIALWNAVLVIFIFATITLIRNTLLLPRIQLSLLDINSDQSGARYTTMIHAVTALHHATSMIAIRRSCRIFERWQPRPNKVFMSSFVTGNNNAIATSSSTPHTDSNIFLSSNISQQIESSSSSNDQKYYCLFDMNAPDGRCVGIQLIPVPKSHPNSILHHSLNIPPSNTDGHQPHWLHNYLHPEEIKYGLQLHHDNHRQSFYMGRLAIRHALQQQQQVTSCSIMDMATSTRATSENIAVLQDEQQQQQHASNNVKSWTNTANDIPSNKGLDSTSNAYNTTIRNSILKDMYGRPKLPFGYLGSISHKGLIGVALVQQLHGMDTTDIESHTASPRIGIGVDIEDITDAHRRRNIARKVLTPNEIQQLGSLSDSSYKETTPSDSQQDQQFTRNLSMDEEILLRFSCKESIYKAIHPLICQYVSFQEAEIQPYTNGTAIVTLNLSSGIQDQLATPIIIHWYRYNNSIITTACIRFK
jgi:4'-phosphopantetheinyl transferase EntD